MKLFNKIISFFLFAAAASNAHAQQTKLTLTNPIRLKRQNELIVLDRSLLEHKLGKLPSAESWVMVKGKNGDISLQFDDTDFDGKWDKLVFLQSFNAGERVDLIVKVTDKKPLAGNVLAHVRQMRKNADNSFGPSLQKDSVAAGQPNTDFSKVSLPPFLTEGPAWENDKVGFRIYMDIRNIKDIWGKTTPKMMMDTVGVDPKVIYHHLAPWGMDILAVGKSLGAGSLALNVPREGKTDTLVRLGGLNMGKIVYQKICDGPVRAVFTLTYPAWNVLGDGKLTGITEEISIWGGKYFYESKVSVKNAPPGAQLVTGIVNLKSHTSLELSINKNKALYTFDQQSENGDNLGMALLVRQKDLLKFGKTANDAGDIRNTYTALLSLKSGMPVAFRYYAAWEHSDTRFATEKGFKNFLAEEASVYNSPIAIK